MNKVFIGDCRENMIRLISQGVKVQTCVTSPPYWGLRDYGHPGQIGLETTPDLYVLEMVRVFSLVYDLLSEDGTLWLNLGDTYAAARSYQVPDNKYRYVGNKIGHKVPEGVKQKDLLGIPWMVAFALRNAGWYLRCDIIWNKANAKPESVQDRPTKSHEYVFLMSKNEKYYYDAEAIKEPSGGWNGSRFDDGKNAAVHPNVGKNRSGNKERKTGEERGRPGSHLGGSIPWEGDTRNKRSVWTVNTVPYPGSHFAVFPPALVEPCILAGSRPGDVVLDPFFGSGTTGYVAEKLGRRWIGCELNEQYKPLWEERTAQCGLSFPLTP